LTPLLVALCWVLSKQPNHAQAETDLEALGAPVSIEENLSPIDTQIHDLSPSHLASIRASMRPESPQPQLDLRGLNTLNPQAKAPSFEIFTPASTPETIAAASSTRSDISPAAVAQTETQKAVVETVSFPPLAVETVAPPIETKVESAPIFANEVALPELSAIAPAEVAPIEVVEKPIDVVETTSTPQVETPVSEPVTETKPKPKKPAPKW
jgi:hypothetical protein